MDSPMPTRLPRSTESRTACSRSGLSYESVVDVPRHRLRAVRASVNKPVCSEAGTGSQYASAAHIVECDCFAQGLGIEHTAARDGGRRRIRVYRGTASDSRRAAK